MDTHTYLHRVGRTGRFGRQGVAVTILTSKEDCDYMTQIAKKLNIQVTSFKIEEVDKIME